LTIMEDFFRRARAHRLHSLADRRTRETARHLAENGDAAGASDLLDIAELALHPALAAGGGGSSAFMGCRAHLEPIVHVAGPGSLSFVSRNDVFSGDTYYYDVGGFFNFVNDESEIAIPQDGYYRIGINIRFDFPTPDATYAQAIIASQARDGQWDTDDHVSGFPVGDPPNTYLHGSVTHWLAAGDDVFVSVSHDSSQAATIQGAIEIEYVGSGTNPSP
jgi:hypothetical protein